MLEMNQSNPKARAPAAGASRPVSSGISLGKRGKYALAIGAGAIAIIGLLRAASAGGSKDGDVASEGAPKTAAKPALKKGERFIDPETGETLIVNPVGGRKKKSGKAGHKKKKPGNLFEKGYGNGKEPFKRPHAPPPDHK